MPDNSDSKLRLFLRRWAITTLGVVVAANVVRGIAYDNFTALIVASLLLGVFNAVLRPVLMLLTLPLVIVSLGLFTLIINALMLYAVGWLVSSFHVRSFGSAFWGALFVSVTSLLASMIFGGGVRVANPPNPSPKRNDPSSGGPIIDV